LSRFEQTELHVQAEVGEPTARLLFDPAVRSAWW
jgi:hypothetical protein